MKKNNFYLLFLFIIICTSFSYVYAENKLSNNIYGYTSVNEINVYEKNSVFGDINKDGYVDSKDAAIILQMASGIIKQDTENADLNKDGYVDSKDATLLLMYVSGANKDIVYIDTTEETTEATTITEETTEEATITEVWVTEKPVNPPLSEEPDFELTTNLDFTYFDFSSLDNGTYNSPYSNGIFTVNPSKNGFIVGFDRYDYILLTSPNRHEDVNCIEINASKYTNGFILKVGGRADGYTPSRIAVTDEAGNVLYHQDRFPFYGGDYTDLIFTVDKPGKYILKDIAMADFKLHQLSIKGL